MTEIVRPVAALTYPATPEAAHQLLNTPIGDDGRSPYEWIVLPNGDLALAIWPKGDTFFALETAVEADYQEACKNDTVRISWGEEAPQVTVRPGEFPRMADVFYPDD